MFSKLLFILISPFLLLAQHAGVDLPSKNVGAFNQVGGLTYRLKSTIGSTNTSIPLSSFKNRSDIPLTMTLINSSIGYGTLDPQSSNSEFVSFTGITQNSDGSATLTGVTRGLSDFYPYAASTTLAQPHSGQSIFILSDSPSFFTEYAIKRNAESITGQWTFASTSLPLVEITTTDAQVQAATNTLATVNYVNSFTTTGCANATTGVRGCVELATNAEQAAGTRTGGTGANLVLFAANSSSTYNGATAGNTVIVTGSNGTIDPNFISTSSPYTWTSTSTHRGTTSILAATNTAPLIINGLSFGFGSTRGATSSAPLDDGYGNVTWMPISRIVASTTDPINVGAGVSSTTIYRNTIPAGALGTNSQIRVRINGLSMGDSGSCHMTFCLLNLAFSFGNGTNTVSITNTSATSLNALGFIEWNMVATSSANSQRSSILQVLPISGLGTAGGNSYTGINNSFTQTNASLAQTLMIVGSSSRMTFNSDQITVEILR